LNKPGRACRYRRRFGHKEKEVKQKFIGGLLTTFVIIACSLQASATDWQEPARLTKDLPVREEVNRKFQFTGFGQVDVSGVAGDVTIETRDSNAVDVYVVRSGETQADLDCYQTVIDNTPDALTIRHKQQDQGRCQNIRARQRVVLRVPRAVNVGLKGIAGIVDVGRIDGVLRLQGIAGHAKVADVREAEIEGLAKGLTMSIRQPAARGIRVSGIVGQVELVLATDVNADLRISSLVEVDAKTRGVSITKVKGDNESRRFGAGGPIISISGIVGGVRINR
jgi:hypothetical protein